MHTDDKHSISDFWVIGINYRKSDTALRGQYAINEQQYAQLLETAPAYGISELFVLSTCNRTEVYGFSKDASSLITLLCSCTEGDSDHFFRQAYIRNGNEALKHIFNVAGGLDSQILGDYEIVGQMKLAVAFAKERGYVGTFTERLFNSALQASRAIRSETQLSSGTVSVAYAAVQFILNVVPDLSQKKILIIGSGKIGKNTCRNLVEKAGREQITLVNRTEERARQFAEELGLQVGAYRDLEQHITDSDIIIVATNATSPVLRKAHLAAGDKKVLIDLSIPNNIDPEVRDYAGVQLADVDALSKINDETLRRREAEVPRAKALITCQIHDFAEWYLMRRNVPVLKAVKQKLNELNNQLFEARKDTDNQAVQKALNGMAMKMRTEERRPGCNYIETINDYMSNTLNEQISLS
ncbi:glutamyl-tRNA reductase [Taibaiella chishuiensis]|uniref:Glutamyl-tRNA reductase n=1 Tax=Taibaiella chishuiensis TaxID=1434707 RepID=A0A2P8CXK2_9BACT|nr:glutamyl-tRNA reductase [Taibaiella chishuiensis]PSK89713.1 glutamyl-tRNA reductase [Taibaiella chishuiensis]